MCCCEQFDTGERTFGRKSLLLNVKMKSGKYLGNHLNTNNLMGCRLFSFLWNCMGVLNKLWDIKAAFGPIIRVLSSCVSICRTCRSNYQLAQTSDNELWKKCNEMQIFWLQFVINFLGVEVYMQLTITEKCMESGLKCIYFALDFKKTRWEGGKPSPQTPPPSARSCLGSGLRTFITEGGGQMPPAMRGGS